MRLQPIHLAAIPLAAVAIALACDTPVSPRADVPAPTAPAKPAADIPSTAPTPSHSSLELVGPAAQSAPSHSALGIEEHVALHVGQAQSIEEESDARVLAAFKAAGASPEFLQRMQLEQQQSRNKDAKHLRKLLTTVLTR